MKNEEHIDNLIEFISSMGYDMSLYYKNPYNFNVDIYGQWDVHITHKYSNIEYMSFSIGADLYRDYLRKNKLKIISNKINA